jgi:molybdopterin-containing oxidoreductase family iron-sulfur binding subunit
MIDRRRFLQLMSAALALAEGGCARAPPEPIVPYALQPEGLVDGIPRFYATALTRSGYAHGVLVESQMGRPTKIEGNPDHPASLGATGPIEQGRILELWDPERSRACLKNGQIVPTAALFAHLKVRGAEWTNKGGAGLRILRGATSSPTLLRQEAALLARFPNARVHCHEAVDRDDVHAGAHLVLGQAAEPVYHFDRARVIVSLDGDFMGTLPGHCRYAREFALRRRPESGAMSRLYCAESMPSNTGACADHHLSLPASAVGPLADELWESLQGAHNASAHGWLQQVLQDLKRTPGESLIVAGDAQPPRVHALAYLLNHRLGNLGRTVEFISPVCGETRTRASFATLVEDMSAGQVETLLILQCNPVYTTPGDLPFARALRWVPESVHFGLYVDETAAQCTWHVPAAHELEDWSDARAYNGTATIQQPLIAPLYGGVSVHALMNVLTSGPRDSAHALVQETWRTGQPGSFDEWWQSALRSGVVKDTAVPAIPSVPSVPPSFPPAAGVRDSAPIELSVRADPNLYDGRYATIAWLQELPKSISQLTWDNAALMGAQQAAALGVTSESLVELAVGDDHLVVPVWIVPQHASGAITLHLGGGRTHAGPIGNGCGVNAYPLRRHDAPWHMPVRVRRLEGTRLLAAVQQHHRMEGRELVRSAPWDEFKATPTFAQREAERGLPSLYPPAFAGEHAWGMAIDLGACMGCNACTIACQSENNIPTVGKDQVLRGRVMHWIRVDRYEEPAEEAPRIDFQPVPCMQCEHAPCEVVCPVEASVHDPEGINVQVYNRCVGTRFCSNNCPYKVRRFNFLQYARDDPALNAQRNPEVTVRMRGVMEKCNYCLQRILRARITADREGRDLHDGEVVTACQAVCPTQAIVFGDLNDPQSAVTMAKRSPRNYALLGELNTRPRTTYLAKVTNPSPPATGRSS